MRKRKSILALLLGFALASTSMPANVFANNISLYASTENETTQMVSKEEVIRNIEYKANIRTQNFDMDWKFFLGDLSGAESKSYNDSKWEEIDLPHDYSITGEYSKNMEAESAYLGGGTAWYRKRFNLPSNTAGKRVRIDFDGVYMNSSVYVNGTLLGKHPYGYTPFSYDITDYLNIDEENIIAVKVEHKTPSSRWYSGSGIYRSVNLSIFDAVHVDLWGTKITTPNLSTNQSSPELKVKTDIKNDSTEIKNIKLRYTLLKKSDSTVVSSFESNEESIAAGTKHTFETSTNVDSPDLWSLDNPNLYTLKTDVCVDSSVVDTVETDFGFRYINFDANTGFSLNGTRMKLKGVCMHHDQGALGAIDNYTAIKRQVEILKDMGCNSIRVTHNPASSNLLKICDELGMLLIEEAFDGWHGTKNGNRYDYSGHFNTLIGENKLLKTSTDMKWHEYDLSAMIERGYNSPSIIMWSLSNEVIEGYDREDAVFVPTANKLANLARSIDNTRLVTVGDNRLKNSTNTNSIYARMDQEVHNAGGAVGMNYASGRHYDSWHAIKPDWILYGSETASSVNSRGIYKINSYLGTSVNNAGQELSSYDKSRVGWGAFASEAWYEVIKRDFVAGEYIWTGFDYLGEPTPWNGINAGVPRNARWEAPKNSYFGIIDTAGLPKDSYYLYRSLWNEDSTTLHILPAWEESMVDNPNNVEVVVYSNARSVRLYFTNENGTEREIGFKTFTDVASNNGGYTYRLYQGADKEREEHRNLYFTFRLPFERGSLRAVAYSDAEGRVEIANTVGRNVVKTTKEAKAIRLKQYVDTDDKIFADGKDLAYIEVEIVDEDGNIVPYADNKVEFEVEGEGKLVGLDNGRQADHTPYTASYRKAYSGKLIAIVKASQTAGDITINASSVGLEPASLSLETEKINTNSSETDTDIISYKMSRNYFVKKGSYPILPEKIEVRLSDDTTREELVAWDKISEEDINKVHTFLLKGRLESSKEIYVTINMLDNIAALLNYSTTTPKGVEPILPETRQAVLDTGEVLNISLPIEWDKPEASAYNEVGIVKVRGKAIVLGEEKQVEASVRVQDEIISIGDSISNQASLTQNVHGSDTSDTLDAIKDNSTLIRDVNGGANPSIWSNWASARAGKDRPELIFRYDTQQRIGEIDIYFVRDNHSLRYPDENTTKIYISEDGETYTEVVANEEIAESEISERVKKYTYTFNPFVATFIKIVPENAKSEEKLVGVSSHTSIGISEVELKKASGAYRTNSTANLASLRLNQVDVPKSSIDSRMVKTEALLVDSIEFEALDNASVTYVPHDKDAKFAYVIVESEDHVTRNTIEIALGSEKEIDASNDSRDYPLEKTTYTAGSEQIPQDPVTKLTDNNVNTIWHSNWWKTLNLSERYLLLELEEETDIEGLRYYSRNGESNGRVAQYEILVSTDNNSFESVATGTWDNTSGWKAASFKRKKAKYIKLIGRTTYGEGAQQNKFMSAAEVRAVLASEGIDISLEENGIKARLENNDIIVDKITEPVKAKVLVESDDKELKYGLDYKLEYVDNDRVGNAYVLVKGILNYSGIIKLPYNISSKNARTIFLDNANIVAVNDKETLLGSSKFEKDTELIIRAEEKEGKEFAYWQLSPNEFSIDDIASPEILISMPEHSLGLKAIYKEEGIVEPSLELRTNDNTWYADFEEADMKAIFEDSTSFDEINSLNAGDKLSLVLELNKRENNLLKATPSELETNVTEAFYIDTKLYKEKTINSEVSKEDINEVKNLTLTIEVPKKDRNMADYSVVAFKKSADEVYTELVEAVENDGYLSFVISTDTVYGIYYEKAYEIIFENYDNSIINIQNVKLGELPIVPNEDDISKKEAYIFVGFDKEIEPAKRDRKYKAIFELDESVLANSRQRLTEEIDKYKTFLSENEGKYTSTSIKELEKALVKAETLLDNSTSFVKLENQIQEIRAKVLDLKLKANTSSTGTQTTPVEKNTSSTGTQTIPVEKNTGSTNVSSGTSSSSARGSSLGSSARVRSALSSYSRKTNNAELPVIKMQGKWEKVSDKWKYKQNGRYLQDTWGYVDVNNTRNYYLFDSNGIMFTGWYKAKSGKWYYLEEAKNEKEGLMVRGFKWIPAKNGKLRQYYFDSKAGNDGALLVNTTVEGKYQVNSDGAWIVDNVVVEK